MLFQDEEQGHVIIGEAALHLALAKREITALSLIAELGRMRASVKSNRRLHELSEARNWLRTFITPEHTVICKNLRT
ncbi:hypothetical protein [Kalamiella sp. sgz302252]|uniref:hypothetical protein n=1 Tax=Pantoea sp. sgz302252 TaxID=3341827 RepID=UPI0036D24F27